MRGGYVLHIGVVEGCFQVGDKVHQQIDGVSLEQYRDYSVPGRMYGCEVCW